MACFRIAKPGSSGDLEYGRFNQVRVLTPQSEHIRKRAHIRPRKQSTPRAMPKNNSTDKPTHSSNHKHASADKKSKKSFWTLLGDTVQRLGDDFVVIGATEMARLSREAMV